MIHVQYRITSYNSVLYNSAQHSFHWFNIIGMRTIWYITYDYINNHIYQACLSEVRNGFLSIIGNRDQAMRLEASFEFEI